MEVRGAQLLHSLDGTKHHPFVTPGCSFFIEEKIMIVPMPLCCHATLEFYQALLVYHI